MKKVSELEEGPELDCWVAKAINPEEKVYWYGDRFGIRWNGTPPRYSSEWEKGGPLIDQFLIDFDQNKARASHVRCRALVDGLRKSGELSSRVEGWGPTVLVAAMRALVARSFGETVEPDTRQTYAD